MKLKIVSFITALFLVACSKEYSCVCKSLVTGSDTLIETVKTTKLGLKGYSDACKDKDKTHKVTDCSIK